MENQIGFDAVFVSRDAEFVLFVQLSRGESHSFKMDRCKRLLSKLSGCDIKVVEFCFVVRDDLIHKFKISAGKKVTGRGSLSQYKVAGCEMKWEESREEQDAVILGMEDII